VLRLGWMLGVLWGISRRLLEFFEELEGGGGGGGFGGFGARVGGRRGAAAVDVVFCCGVFGGVCGGFGWCWRRRVFYVSRRGASRRGCKPGEDRGAPRGDIFCGWVSPGGGLRILGLCGGGCVVGRVSGSSPWLVSGGRWGNRWAEEVGLGGSLVVFVLLGRRVEWSPRRVDGLATRLGFVGE
jgi:hypothetical protein